MIAQNVAHENEEEMSPTQAKFVDCLLAGANLGAAALTCKVSLKTATRWNRLPAVKSALRVARQEIFEDRLAELKEAVPTAIKTLVKHMTDEGTAPYVQVQAATAVLNVVVQLFRSDEVEARLMEMEKRLKDVK